MSSTTFIHLTEDARINVNETSLNEISISDGLNNDFTAFFDNESQMRLLAEKILIALGPKDSWNEVNDTAAKACGIEPFKSIE